MRRREQWEKRNAALLLSSCVCVLHYISCDTCICYAAKILWLCVTLHLLWYGLYYILYLLCSCHTSLLKSQKWYRQFLKYENSWRTGFKVYWIVGRPARLICPKPNVRQICRDFGVEKVIGSCLRCVYIRVSTNNGQNQSMVGGRSWQIFLGKTKTFQRYVDIINHGNEDDNAKGRSPRIFTGFSQIADPPPFWEPLI